MTPVRFVLEFQASGNIVVSNVSDKVKAFQQFCKFILLRFHKITGNDRQYDRSLMKECVERYVISKIYIKAFFIQEEDTKVDLEIKKKAMLHSWMEEKHLDLVHAGHDQARLSHSNLYSNTSSMQQYQEAGRSLDQLQYTRSPIEVMYWISRHARCLFKWMNQSEAAAYE